MYFKKSGRGNTTRTIALAMDRGRELGIKNYVFASTTGSTARQMLRFISRRSGRNRPNLVCVTHQSGFEKPGKLSLDTGARKLLEAGGVKVIVATHLFRGLDKALALRFQGVYPPEIVANTLKLFSEGVKVGVEIAIMALDGGLLPFGKDCVALGGTGRGLDTALVIRPAHSYDFFDTRIKEIICKPY